MSRTYNAVRNISWGIVQKIVTLLLPFITRTVLIKSLGADYLGLSGLFTSVLSLLSLTELGVSNAIISTMYKPIAERDEGTICALMNLYRKAYHVIGILIALLGISITPFLDRFIKGDLPIGVNIYVLYLIYLANTSISYFLFAYKNCLLVAHQRNDINSKIQTVLLIVQNIVQIVLVVFFKNYYCYVIVIPFITITTNIITACYVKKLYPQYVCKGRLANEKKGEVKERVLGLMLGKISATIRSSIDSMFISMFLGLTAVAMYSNYFYIVTAIVGVIQIVEASLIAGVGDSIATESIQKNYHDCNKFTFLIQWVVGWCAICILCLEQPFMEIWMGKTLMFKDAMVYLCAMYLFVNCIGLIRSIYTQALGMWWTLRYLSIADIFVNIALNYVLGIKFGAYGIIAATVVDIVLVSIPWTTYYLFRDYFGKEYYRNYMGGYIKYFLVATVVGGLTYVMCQIIKCDDLLLGFMFKCLVCIFIPNICYYILFHKNQYFNEMIAIIKNKIRSIKVD